MRALNLLIENPEISIDKIVDILRASEKTKRPLTHSQVLFALIRATNSLYRRVVRFCNASREEIELWQKIKSKTSQDQDKNVLKTFRDRLIAWFRRGGEVSQAEIAEVEERERIKVEPLTDEEAAVLGTILCLRDDLLTKYGLEKLPRDIVRNLVGKIRNPLEMSEEQLEQFRMNSLQKVKEIIRSDRLDQIYDSQNPDTQYVLIYFTVIDPESTFHLLEEILTIPRDTFWKEQKGRIIEFWTSLRREPESDGSKQEVVVQQLSVSPKIEKKRRSKKSAIEKTDPKVKEHIDVILDRIEEKNIAIPLTGAQLTRNFPVLKRKTLDMAADNGYISPYEKGHVRVYSISDIALLLYMHDFGNSLNSRQLKDLKKLIGQEIKKRESKKKK